MDLRSLPFVTITPETRPRAARLPGWLASALRPQGVVGSRAQVPWTIGWALAALALGASDAVAPRPLGLGGLVVLPIVGAAWMLGARALAAVVGITVAFQAVSVVSGTLAVGPGVTRVVSVAIVALVGRAAAAGYAQLGAARRHELRMLLGASRMVGRSLDRPAVMAEATRAAAGVLGPPAPGRPALRRAVLLREDRGRMTVASVHDDTAEPGAPPLLPLPPATGDLPAAVLATLTGGAPAVVPAADLEPLLGELAVTGGVGAWAVAPVLVAARPFGTLAVAAPTAARVGADDLRLLDGVAQVAGTAIAASLEHAELSEVKGNLEANVALALEVARSLQPADVVASIVSRLTDTVGAGHAALARVVDGGLVLESTYRASPPCHVAPLRRRFPAEVVAGVPALAGALATGGPVIDGRLTGRPGSEDLVAALPSSSSTLAFPLMTDGRAMCLVVLGREGLPFRAPDAARLTPMADVALLALRNAQLFAEAEQATRVVRSTSSRLQLAIDAAEDIGSSPELAEVVERVLRRAATAVRAERGSVARIVEGDTVVVEHEHDPAGGAAPAGTWWGLATDPLAADAVRRRRPVRDLGTAGGVGHVIQCPLVVEDQVVGLLTLRRTRDEPFSEGDLLTMQPFATLSGLLLRNARLLAEARQVGRARGAFLNLAAHELRTPLAVIRGYLSLLEDGTYPVPDLTRDEAVRTLVTKAEELESLVEALVTTARLEGGGLAAQVRRLDLCQAAQEAAARIRGRARLEGASVELRLPDGPRPVAADGAHIGRILDNLLNNALSYSDAPAAVTIEVRAPLANGAVQLAVTDRGRGIPAEHHARVFERFQRLAAPASRHGAGLGLGLSISRELAALNGGALVLERSAPGAGSTFVLRLPVPAAPAADLAG